MAGRPMTKGQSQPRILPNNPLTGIEQCQQCMIRNTVSQSWRLGRAVSLARHKANLGNLGPVLVDTLGGPSTAKVLFSGKITEVNRTMYKGHSVGEVVIQALQVEEEDEEDEATPREKYEGVLKSECHIPRRGGVTGEAVNASPPPRPLPLPTSSHGIRHRHPSPTLPLGFDQDEVDAYDYQYHSKMKTSSSSIPFPAANPPSSLVSQTSSRFSTLGLAKLWVFPTTSMVSASSSWPSLPHLSGPTHPEASN